MMRFKCGALAVFFVLLAGEVGFAETNNVPLNKDLAGYKLFDRNCAHCHGDDARGDEGPDLHGLTKSDARIERIIKNGIHGEMPAFGKKFGDEDVKQLIVWLRTLK